MSSRAHNPHSAANMPGWRLYVTAEEDATVLPLCLSQLSVLQRFLDTQQIDVDLAVSVGSFSVSHAALVSDGEVLLSWPDIAECVSQRPRLCLCLLGLAMYQIACAAYRSHCEPPEASVVVAAAALPRLLARLVNFSPLSAVRSVQAASYGRFVAVRGVVLSVGDVTVRCLALALQCVVCGHVMRRPADASDCRCARCRCQRLRPLTSHPFTETLSGHTVRLQELTQPPLLPSGPAQFHDCSDDLDEVERTDAAGDCRSSRSCVLECRLTADLVDACAPGDVITVCGMVCAHEHGRRVLSSSSVRSSHDIYIDVNSVRCIVRPPMKATAGVLLTRRHLCGIAELQRAVDVWRLLVNSLCPAVCGRHMVKAGLLLALFGGRFSAGDCGCHVLLVGDPGLGKSQLLAACVEAAPRCVPVCGGGGVSTGAALTATVSDGRLDAGALPLADCGCCCIDELHKLTAVQQCALQEAMTDGAVCGCRGGLVCRLPARVCVVAAAAPAGGSHYDRRRSVTENLRVSPALLSCFQLRFVLVDRVDGRQDSLVSSHIMAQQAADAGHSSCLDVSGSTDASLASASSWHTAQPLAERLAAGEASAPLPIGLVRRYIAYARRYVQPRLSREACERLRAFDAQLNTMAFDAQRLPALLRLTEARARVQLAAVATAEHADDVVQLVTHALETCGELTDGELTYGELTRGKMAAGRRHSGRGRTGRLRRWVGMLGEAVRRLRRTTFSEAELRQFFAAAAGSGGGSSSVDFRQFTDMANEAGMLIKKGHQLYEVQVD